jgi:hypothetical protein
MANTVEIAKANSNTFDILVNKKIVTVTADQKLRYPMIRGIQEATIGGDHVMPYREQTLRSAIWELGIKVGTELLSQYNDKKLKVVKNELVNADGEPIVPITAKIPSNTDQAVEFGLLPPDVLEGRATRAPRGTGGGSKKTPKANLARNIERTKERISVAKNRVTELEQLLAEMQKEHDAMPADPEPTAAKRNSKNGKKVMKEREFLMENANMDSLKKIAKQWNIAESEYKGMDKATFIELILKTEHPNDYAAPASGVTAEQTEQQAENKTEAEAPAKAPAAPKKAARKKATTTTRKPSTRKTAQAKKAEAEANAANEALSDVVSEVQNAKSETRSKMIQNMDLLNLATIADKMGVEVIPGMNVTQLRDAIIAA